MIQSQLSGNRKIVELKTEEDLPAGEVISYEDGELPVGGRFRNSLLAWKLDEKPIESDVRGYIWIVSTKSEISGNPTYQLIKDAENNGYKVVRRAVTNQAFINTLYNKKMTNLNQEANIVSSDFIKEFTTILEDATKEGVSDIHLEVRRSGGIIRMRKNADMRDYRNGAIMTYERAIGLASVVYQVLAQNKSVTFDPRECQQASVSYTIDNKELRVRYQSVPAYPDGFDVILRVLSVDDSEEFTPLQKLGYTDHQTNELIRITSRSVGSLIIAGVTGSGKSTTMKNLLMFINANSGYRLKIYTIEDPPEYNIARVTQIPVNLGKDIVNFQGGSPFEKPIKACMRGDPDIIMIGEVRDGITGDLTKKAVQSGHQVLTTVHATSALGIIDRFVDFSVTRSVLGSPDFLSGLLYQRLLPVVCPKCSMSFKELLSSDMVKQEHVVMASKISKILANSKKGYQLSDFDIRIRSDSGCDNCGGTGVVGRSVAAEVMSIDINMLSLIEKGESIELMKYWRSLSDGDPASTKMSGKTCMEHGFLKVLNGIVCPFDLERSFKPLEEMEMNEGQVEVVEDSSADWLNL